MSEYASHYKQGGMQTADKIEYVCNVLRTSDYISGAKIADVAHALKYFDRTGLKLSLIHI